MSASKLNNANRITVFVFVIFALLFTQVGSAYAVQNDNLQLQAENYAIVFVSRKIQPNGSVYLDSAASMPGVGPYSRNQVSAPGRLLVREANGTLRTLIDGSKPTAASLNLIDVNSPDVSYNGTKIVFAGLVAGTYSTAPMTNPGGWRIYTVNVDGTGLQQVTVSDRDNLDLSQFGAVGELFKKYDDIDPAWLPDGRIVFSSTRWPEFGQYGGVHASNLYVVNANGTSLHRITSERNGADRPLVDPLTGKIVYSRWWRNFRVATDDMSIKPDPQGGYIMKDGLLSVIYSQPPPNTNEVGGFRNLDRNTWHLATINPDGTELAQWGGRSSSFFYGQIANHAYGGGFAPDGTFYANFFPMNNMTEAAGFGGIRRYTRGPNGYASIIGVTYRNDSKYPLVSYDPPSYGIYQSNYAGEPEVLPDGRLLISLAKDIKQDYGLYTINPDGSGLTPVYDNVGTTELRARVIRSRPVPPIISDKITQVASLLPPLASGPYDKDGTFTFQALNVYFNAPVDSDIISAMPVGSASKIRFFIDHQRSEQTGSHEGLDWPIVIKEVPVNPDGSVTNQSPANVPLFEQIRGADNKVPLTGKAAHPEEMGGAAHVAGMNFGRPGEVAQCVGCHAGHSMIPVPSNPEDAKWTNLAPGATVSVSSLDSSLPNTNGLVDRRVKMAFPEKYQKYWISRAGTDPKTQWVQLTFPVPVTVRTVRLYNIPAADSAVKVEATTVKLFSDTGATNLVGSNTSGVLSASGTNVTFTDLQARVVRVEFNSVSGGPAALAEMEVIARAGGNATNAPTVTPIGTGTAGTVTATYTPTPTVINAVSATPTYTFTPTAINALTTTPTYTFTPTAINAKTSTPTAVNSQPTSTPVVLPTMTAINISTFTAIPTFTALPTKTSTVAAPTTSPNALVIPPASLTTERGTTKGSLPTLGTLKLSGTQDDPNEYVAFQTQNSKYAGYLSYMIPAGVGRSSTSELSLQVNFKTGSKVKQKWVWSIYDWNTKKWFVIGTVSGGGNNQWKMLKFTIKQSRQYASPGNEVRVQVRSDNSPSGAMIDYQVLQLTNPTTSAQSAAPVLPTLIPSATPPAIPATPTVNP